MQEEEFYATIKLVTGEEIVSKVCYMPDEDSLILENPLEVLKCKTNQRSTRGKWIHSKNGSAQRLINVYY